MSRLAAMLLCPLLAGGGPAHAAGPAVDHSTIAFTLKEKDLLPESLAYDPQSGYFLVGSTRSGGIREVAAGCREWDFVAARAHGLWMVTGMKADPKRRALWVASSDGGNLVGHGPGRGAAAGLFEFDLDTGGLIGRYLLQDTGAAHFLDDLVVAPDGDVYVTHSYDTGQVWRLDADTRTFAPFYRGDAGFHNPSGITVTPDGKRLYVADDFGISAIDIAQRIRRPLAAATGLKLAGVEGLYLYDHSLVLIQPKLKRVSRCALDQAGLTVTDCRVLEQDHPLFDDPTTGVIVDNTLYYIANSQFDSVDSEGRLPPLERLYQPVILKLEL